MAQMGKFLLWLGLAIVVVGNSALAQTTFSFSGLKWGDEASRVISQLKSAGYSVGVTEIFKCKVNPECALGFEGPVNGMAFTHNKVLNRVVIYSNRSAYDERLSRLKERYGQPIVPRKPDGMSNIDFFASNQSYLRWHSPSGEELVLAHDGSMVYYAPEKYFPGAPKVNF